MNPEYTGRCLCKAVRYSIIGDISHIYYCHCESCRRATGSAFVAWGTADKNNFQVTNGELSIFKSSRGVQRGFCSRCGTTLTYWHFFRDDEIDFTLASLDQSYDLKPQFHVWVQDKLPWVELNDNLPQFQTVPPAPEK